MTVRAVTGVLQGIATGSGRRWIITVCQSRHQKCDYG